MILVIDNYDSFVYNLARYVCELGAEPLVRRHDAVSLEEIAALAPSHIIISPGPCAPADAGISIDVVRRFGPTTPILGVCLGHQCVGAAYGAAIVRAERPVHGKASVIRHDGHGLFAGLPNPFLGARYHSLVVSAAGLPSELRITATSDDGAIMALAHSHHPVVGVQFHPESVLSEHGYALLYRFLSGVTASDAMRTAPADAVQPSPLLPDAERREHAIEDVVRGDHADELVQGSDGRA